MNKSQNNPLAQHFAAVAATLAIIGGLATFCGWYFDIGRLIDWFNLGVTMKANAAVTTTLIGTALLITTLWPHRLLPIRTVALAGALIGGATLVEHATGWNLGIDTLLFDEPPDQRATAAPGRMGPPAATSFILLGIALIAISNGYRRFAVNCALLVLAVATLSLVGYWYGAEVMYAVPRLTGISLQMALLLLLLSIGTIVAVPDSGPMKLLSSQDSASALAWRLLPAVVLVPLATGWLRLQGERMGWYDAAFGTAFRTLVEMTALCALAWWAVRAIQQRDMQRSEAEMELRRADRRKDEFLATLAHELRNPLAPIRQAALLARKPELSDTQRQWSNDVIERQLQHMSLLLDDLLDVSRITRGTLQLRRTVSSIQSIVHSAVETTLPLVNNREHSLEIDMPAAEVMVNVDPLRIAQVISNLLSNAAKYTDLGGTIRLRISITDTTLHISVADNGIGIAPEHIPEIFRMFGQIKGEQERSEGGLGIGLALTKGVVELHGGTIEVHSVGRGAGSTFSIVIPDVVVHETTQRARQVEHAETVAPCKILITDDNVDAANSLELLLSMDGHEVRVAHDGQTAMRIATEFRPDIALLDIGLPDMSGHQLAKAMRQDDAHNCPLLIAITGWGQQDDRERSADAGFDHHLTKPVDYGELTKLLQPSNGSPQTPTSR